MTVIAAPPTPYITLSSAGAASGSTVDGSGGGFSPVGGAIQLQLDGSTTTLPLWSGAPDRGGAVAFSFTVPSVQPGSHTVVATQAGSDGEPGDGMSATASLEITAAGATGGQQQHGQGSHQKQPGSQLQGQPQAPDVPPVTAAPTIATVPATVAPPAAGQPVVFTLPALTATRLTNPPPQVATLWRIGGAVPRATTVAAPIIAPTAPPPATSTGSREAPSVLTLVALALLVTSAIVLIATTLQLRGPAVITPEVATAAPQRQRAQRRSATMPSTDLWNGSPARLR